MAPTTTALGLRKLKKNALAYPVIFTEEKSGFDVAFPDFPRAHTCGRDLEAHRPPDAAPDGRKELPGFSRVRASPLCASSLEEAYRMAVDCLHATIEYALEEKEEIPDPSRTAKGQYSIPVALDLAPKVALLQLMRQLKVSNLKLAARMKTRENVVRRMLDPKHRSKPEQYIRALAALGAAVQVSVVPTAPAMSK